LQELRVTLVEIVIYNLNASSIYVVALDPQVDDIYHAIVETARTGQHE
jgi:nitrogen regulatory protein PII